MPRLLIFLALASACSPGSEEHSPSRVVPIAAGQPQTTDGRTGAEAPVPTILSPIRVSPASDLAGGAARPRRGTTPPSSRRLAPEAAASPNPGSHLPSAVSALFEAGERVLVTVDFEAPSGRTAAGRRAIATIRDDLVRIAGPGFAPRFEPRSVAVLGGECGPDAATRLLADPRVRGIDRAPGGGGGLAEALPLSGFTLTRARGLDGTGTTVAVVDTGIQRDHEDLDGAVVAEACFCRPACCPNGENEELGPDSAADDHWHGTFVSGVVASRGASAPEGAIPGAELVVVKLLDSQNRFETTLQLVDALDWLFLDAPAVHAVNLSLGTDELFPGSCDDTYSWTRALFDAVANLESRGTSVVASSMNDGDPNRMATPACLSNVISVGSYVDEGPSLGEPAGNTNSGPTLDLFAPGARITSSGRGGGTRSGSGTSFAAPQVSACAALLRQRAARPLAEIRAALVANPSRTVTDAAGRVIPALDCARALGLTPDADAGIEGDAGRQDAGEAGALDSGADDGGVGDGGAPATMEDDGCGCQSSSPGAWLPAFLLLALSFRRRSDAFSER